MTKSINSAKRDCPICEGKKNTILYTQHFANYFSHCIACCDYCGFVFVNKIPGQKFYNRYYRDMSKYEHDRDQKLHEKTYGIIKKYCSKSDKVLDIGCATGHLLHLLKQDGYLSISGIDPSPQCKKMARSQFGIKIETADLSSFKTKKKYDFVILSAVLEHLREVKISIEKISSLLADGGKVFISVPDAEHFHTNFVEPFGEFSTEHINFFSRASLFRAMMGYTNVYMESDQFAIYSVWKKGSELKASVNEYIKLSQERQKIMDKVVKSLPKKVLVWGAGSLTQRLLKSTGLKAKVRKFIDRNEALQGKKLEGIEVVAPNKLVFYKEPVLISSFRFKEEIRREIKSKGFKNRVITF